MVSTRNLSCLVKSSKSDSTSDSKSDSTSAAKPAVKPAAKPAASAPRDRYHHGDLRQSLIDAAIALIQDGDLSQVSLREVSRRVGVSHNAPYRHFQDKEALLNAVAAQGFQGLKRVTEAAIAVTPGDAAEQLQAIGKAYIQFAVQNPVYYRVMFSLSDAQQDAALKEAMAQSWGVLFQVILAGQASSVFRAEDPRQMAQVAWAMVHGIALLAIEGQLRVQSGEDFDAFLEFSTRMLSQGLQQQ